MKKNLPQFYYQNFYDPSRSGAADQLITSSNSISNVNQMKSMAAAANDLQLSSNQLPLSLAHLKSNQQASQAGLGGLGQAAYGGGSAPFGGSTFSSDAAAVAALYGLQQRQVNALAVQCTCCTMHLLRPLALAARARTNIKGKRFNVVDLAAINTTPPRRGPPVLRAGDASPHDMGVGCIPLTGT